MARRAGGAAPSGEHLLFDRFQRSLTEPNLEVGLGFKLKALVFQPVRTWRMMRQNMHAQRPESLFAQLKMYQTLHGALDKQSRKQLKNLLKHGVLHHADTDNRHSALYNLYGMLTTPRGTGYDGKTLVRETLDVLSRPYEITQKFEPLSEHAARQILQARNNPGLLHRAGSMPPPERPLNWSDLQVQSSATCVSASLMYYMADKQPGELVRHLNELTSPMNAFLEKARLDEISPDDPAKALDILKEQGLKYFMSGPGEVTIRVENPVAGKIRAVDSQDVQRGGPYRNAIQSAYQSALTKLGAKTYDPATDTPSDGSKGLTEAEKTLMETIIKDNGGVQSVTYQVLAGKNGPQGEQDTTPHLYGYARSFEQTTADLLEALKMGESVIVGITYTAGDGDAPGGNPSAAIVGGHEITITGAFVDKKDGELKFVVADSDDEQPSLVVRSARELIPRIHHAGLPLALARRINQEVARNPGYYIPDHNDAAQFNLLPHETGPMPAQDTVSAQDAAPSVPPQQAPAAMTPPQTSPQVDWVPVYQYHNPMPAVAAMPPQQAFYPPAMPAASYAPAPTPATWPASGGGTFVPPGPPTQVDTVPGYPHMQVQQFDVPLRPGAPWPGATQAARMP